MFWPLRSTYYLNAWNRLQMKLTSKFVKILRWGRVVFQLSSQRFIWWNTDLHNKKYNKWKFSQGFTFTHVQNFGDNDNRAKLRVINPSLAGTSLKIVDILENRQQLNPHPTNQKIQTFEWNNLPSLGIRASY